MGLLFIALALLPLLDLYLLIRMGRAFGAGGILGLVLVMGVAGALISRTYGRKVIHDWRQSLAQGHVPEQGVLDGALALFGCLFLILPGILTDVVGALLLIPVTRRAFARGLSSYLAQKLAAGQLAYHQVDVSWSNERSSRPPIDRRRVPRSEDVIDTEGEEV